MYYCENCQFLFDSNRCPFCESEDLRKVRDEDLCFLTEKGTVYGEVLKDALMRENIPYKTHSVKDGCKNAKPGPMVETLRFFVPYGFLNRAKEIEESACRT